MSNSFHQLASLCSQYMSAGPSSIVFSFLKSQGMPNSNALGDLLCIRNMVNKKGIPGNVRDVLMDNAFDLICSPDFEWIISSRHRGMRPTRFIRRMRTKILTDFECCNWNLNITSQIVVIVACHGDFYECDYCNPICDRDGVLQRRYDKRKRMWVRRRYKAKYTKFEHLLLEYVKKYPKKALVLMRMYLSVHEREWAVV